MLHANDPQGQPLAAELQCLRDEAVQLMVLGYQLRQSIDAALAKIEPAAAPRGPELRQLVLDYLRTASNREIRTALIQARGARAAANLRTRLNADLEARKGHRHPMVAGRAVVRNGHGNGAALVAAE